MLALTVRYAARYFFSEAEAAKYAQQVVTLRRECRRLRERLSTLHRPVHIRSAPDGDFRAKSDDAKELSDAASNLSNGTCNHRESEEESCRLLLERLSQALQLHPSAGCVAVGSSKSERNLSNDESPERADANDYAEALEKVCAAIERATCEAEFLTQEWEQVRGNPDVRLLRLVQLAKSNPLHIASLDI